MTVSTKGTRHMGARRLLIDDENRPSPTKADNQRALLDEGFSPADAHAESHRVDDIIEQPTIVEMLDRKSSP